MEDKHTCCATVYWKEAWGSNICGKKAKFCRDGKWYCGTHDPVSIAERQAKRDEKDRPRREREEFEWRKRRHGGEMLAMLERIGSGEAVNADEVKEIVDKVRGGYGA